MSDNFIKALRWYVIVLPSIFGIYAMLMVEMKDTIKPAMIVILGIGLSFILSAVWKIMTSKIMLVTFVMLAVTGIGARYIQPILYIYAGYEWTLPLYLSWPLLTLVMGVPIMTLCFKHIRN